MRISIQLKLAAAIALLLMSGCEPARTMRDDFARLTSFQAAAQKSPPRNAVPSARTKAEPAMAGAATTSDETSAAAATAIPNDAPSLASAPAPAISLAGKSEYELRALLGAPAREEQRPPGKRWHYQDGQCTLDIQLYPDVQTKQFGTLAYEVRSDDNTDEGKRSCLVQLQSRGQNRN